MQVQTKLRIDRTLGRVLCFLLIPFVFLLAKLLRRDHSISKENVRCIVVAKYFGLGSITHAIPMLRALKTAFPDARLIFLSREGNGKILSLIPEIDGTLYVDDSGLWPLVRSNLKLFQHLFRHRVDLFFDLEVFSAYGALVSLFSLSRNRFGFFCSQATDFKAWIYTHLLYFNFQMPVRECYMQLARMAGVPAEASADLIPFRISQEVEEAAAKRLYELVPDKGRGILAVNVNASDLSLARRWPLERFTEAIRHFARQSYCIILLGSPEERGYVQRVPEALAGETFPFAVHNAAGYFSFEELLTVMKHFDVLLTNDTGIMNFAYAQSLKTVSLFGPNTPVRYHPAQSPGVAVHKSIYCSPCLHHLDKAPCGDYAVCMMDISLEEVISHVQDMLDETTRGAAPLAALPMVGSNKGYLFGELKKRL